MGTLVHHVGILRRRGLVETVRMVSQYLIYATGEAAPSAPIGKALADPDLRRLLAWLAANPGHPQRAVLDHAGAAWGWPRSTTQHRLRRLVQAGLVAANRGVRTLRYVVAPRPAAGMAPTAPGHLAEVAS